MTQVRALTEEKLLYGIERGRLFQAGVRQQHHGRGCHPHTVQGPDPDIAVMVRDGLQSGTKNVVAEQRTSATECQIVTVE